MPRAKRDGTEAVRTWAEVGQALGISRQMAEKIGERALEKCRAHLETRGIIGFNTLDLPDDVDRPDCRVHPPEPGL